MLCATGKTCWHGDARLLEGRLGNIAQKGLVKRLEGLFGIGQHIPGGCLALVDAQVVIGVDQRAR